MNDECWNDVAARHADELARLEAMTDDDIDYSDIPPADPEDWKDAQRGLPFRNRVRAYPIERDVVIWFRKRYPDYEAAINDALRAFIADHADDEEAEPDQRKTA